MSARETTGIAMLDWALYYAEELDWAILPCHSPTPGEGGALTCSCGDGPECRSVGKHPLWFADILRHGSVDATTAPETLRRWWGRKPGANLAVSCRGSELLVLDFDISGDLYGGAELARELERRRLELPATCQARTGSGGEHVFLRWPEAELGPPPASGRWAGCLDFKSEGYVLLPPSLHRSGARYEWLAGRAPGQLPPATPSLELAAALVEIRGAAAGVAGSGTGMGLPDAEYYAYLERGAPVGSRDTLVYQHLCRLKEVGRSEDEAAREISSLWEKLEQPPGDEYPLIVALRKIPKIWESERIAVRGEADPACRAWAERLQLIRLGGSEGALVTAPDAGERPGPDAHPAPVDLRTDAKNAERLAVLCGAEFRYVAEWGGGRVIAWLTFDGVRWHRDLRQLHVERAKLVGSTVRREAEALRDAGNVEGARLLAEWARMSESAGKIGAMIRLAEPLLTVSAEELDVQPWLLNTPTGVVDLARPGAEARAAESEDLITKCTSVSVAAPGSAAPRRWEEFLAVALPDEDVREYVRRALGYSLVGVTDEKVIFIVCGPTGTGKTVFIEALSRVLGDYAVTVPTHYICPVGPGGEEDRLRLFTLLRGARLALASEPESGARLNVSVLKDLVGGGRVSARNLYEAPYSYVPEATLWLDTNHFPKVEDFGDDVWEKFWEVPFTVPWPEELRQPREVVLKGLMEEGGAILRWVLEGLEAWLGEGRKLVAPEGLRRAREEERWEQDWVAEFLEDVAEVGNGLRVPCGEMYAAYQRWAAGRGVAFQWTQTRLTRELKRGRGFEVVKVAGARHFEGVRLKTGQGWS